MAAEAAVDFRKAASTFNRGEIGAKDDRCRDESAENGDREGDANNAKNKDVVRLHFKNKKARGTRERSTRTVPRGYFAGVGVAAPGASKEATSSVFMPARSFAGPVTFTCLPANSLSLLYGSAFEWDRVNR